MSGTRKTPRRTRTSSKKPRKPSRPPAFPAGGTRRGGAPRSAPHPATADLAGERLGELPGGYGEDALVALPRDTRSLYLYWDHAPATLQRAFGGLDRPRVQLRLFSRREAGWDRVRVVELALESRGHYFHDLEPGRQYRAELHAVDGAGRERSLGPASTEVSLPPEGPSPVVDDRFVRVPWDRPLGPPLGQGHRRPGFPDDDREALARLSGRHAGLGYGASLFGRPSSPSPGEERER
jgi:hypothetical protein